MMTNRHTIPSVTKKVGFNKNYQLPKDGDIDTADENNRIGSDEFMLFDRKILFNKQQNSYRFVGVAKIQLPFDAKEGDFIEIIIRGNDYEKVFTSQYNEKKVHRYIKGQAIVKKLIDKDDKS